METSLKILEQILESVGYPIDDYIDESKEILKLILNDGTIIEFDSDTVDSEEEN